MVAAQAELAVIAVERGLKRSAVACGEPGNAGAGFDDDARRLVPEHHGIRIGHAADLTLGVGMQIGAADADGFNTALHFARPGIFDGHLGKPEG